MLLLQYAELPLLELLQPLGFKHLEFGFLELLLQNHDALILDVEVGCEQLNAAELLVDYGHGVFR
jgi:hypothetical protein